MPNKYKFQKDQFIFCRFVPQSAQGGFSVPRKYDGEKFRSQPGKIEDYTLGRGIAAQQDQVKTLS